MRLSLMGLDVESPEHAARLITMGAMAYYGLDENIMSDAEYDGLTRIAVDGWAQLPKYRQFQLGSKAKIAATGQHVRVSFMGQVATIRCLKRLDRVPEGMAVFYTQEPKYHEGLGRYWNVNHFCWGPIDAR